MNAHQSFEQQELDRALRAVLATADGKRVLFWMLAEAAVYADAFAASETAMAYQIGRQAVGRRLISKLNHLDPKLYPNLLLAMDEIRSADRIMAERLADKEDDE